MTEMILPSCILLEGASFPNRYRVSGMLPWQTNYSSTFVENSKLKRLLLKVEKDIEKLQSAKEKRKSSATKIIRVVRVRSIWLVF